MTIDNLFQVSPGFTLRNPFRATGPLLFCLAFVVYIRGVAWLWRWFGFHDHTHDSTFRYPIVGHCPWFFTAHARRTLMPPVLNKGMLTFGKKEYPIADIGILALLVCFGLRGCLFLVPD
jgi:hypothetical protein